VSLPRVSDRRGSGNVALGRGRSDVPPVRSALRSRTMAGICEGWPGRGPAFGPAHGHRGRGHPSARSPGRAGGRPVEPAVPVEFPGSGSRSRCEPRSPPAARSGSSPCSPWGSCQGAVGPHSRRPGSSPAAGTRAPSMPWRGTRRAAGWPRAASTVRSSCGTRPPAGSGRPSPGTRARHGPWRGPAGAAGWPRAATTRRSSCGTRPPAGAADPLRARGLRLGLAWDPQGPLAGLGQLRHTIKLWDPATAGAADPLGHAGLRLALAWDPQGAGWPRQLRQAIKLWDPATGQVRQTLSGSRGLRLGPGVGPAGALAGLGQRRQDDQAVGPGHRPGAADPLRTRAPSWALAWDRRGRWLASGSTDATIRV
jgi:hypothetical protein